MNLIYDRTQTDINNALSIRSKYQALGDWSGITEEETAQLKRGTYTCFDDMNRVDAAVRELGGMLTAAGYPVEYTSPIPQPDYTPLDYIESTGTQYIDTGVKPNQDTRLVMTLRATDKTTEFASSLWGVQTGDYNYALWIHTGFTQVFMQYGNEYSTQSIADILLSKACKVEMAKGLKIDGVTYYTAEEYDFDVPYSLTLCATNDISDIRFMGSLQIYSCQIYNGDTLIRDFIPAKQNGKTGLYDKVSGALYPNAGTGEFLYREKPLFNIGDIINYDIWRTYLDNVQAIRDAYYTMPDTPKLPEPTAPLSFDGANAIEKLLYDVQILYNAMSASYRKCGTFQAGNNKQRLPLQRSVT